MFSFLGKFIVRGWPVFLASWVIALIFLYVVAPPWNDVADDREFRFLPEESPSRRGETLFKKAFPNQSLGSNIVMLMHREDRPLEGDDYKFIETVLKPALAQIAEDEGGFVPEDAARPATSSALAQGSIISKINTAKDAGTGPLLMSEDRKATLVVVDLVTEFMERRNWSTVGKMENLLAKLSQDRRIPSGLSVDLTGSATVGRDVGKNQADSGRATGVWTGVMVVVLLLLIYRAPLLAIIPLFALFVAVNVALKILALLTKAGAFTLFDGVEVYMSIIMYGAGVDYCLFLIGRYREELEGGRDMGEALAGAIGKVGPSLAASAATVMFGIGMMTFAGFGKFHYAGMAIFFGLFIGFCAVLTLGVPLLRMMGRWIFWPKMPAAHTKPAPADVQARPTVKRWFFWERLAHTLVRRPGAVWLTSVVLMCPFVVIALLYAGRVNYDLLQRLPDDAPGLVGTRTLEQHFSSGATAPVTILLANPGIDFRTDDNQALLKTFVDRLKANQDALALTDIRSLPTPLGIMRAGRELQKATPDVALPFPPQSISIATNPSISGPASSAPGGEGFLDLGNEYHRQNFIRKRALDHYVSSADQFQGHVTQMQVLVQMNPLSREGAQKLDELESTVRKELPKKLAGGLELYSLGSTASIRDLVNVTSSDETRIRMLVTGCVLLILLTLLRKLVISLYLVASVLFSYFTTLGVTWAVFWALSGPGFPGLDWKVSVLLFAVLVAVGEDYNIFLMTRVAEEQKNRADPVEGISQALVRTGGIITSCGLIMAGTFASLLAGSLADLKQLGFALAFGVLLDTFVVRPILVPTFLIWLKRIRHAPRAALPPHR